MTDLAFHPLPSLVFRALSARWVALAALLLALTLPDCCLNGQHFAFDMQVFGPICRAVG